MDYEWFSSVQDLKETETWTNVRHLGCESKLTAAERAFLLRIKYPNAKHKFAQKAHFMKLAHTQA